MNYHQALELLRHYQIQNPIKYKRKFGDNPPEEAANKLAGINSAPTGILGVKVEVKPKEIKAVEVAFSEPEKPRKPKNGHTT